MPNASWYLMNGYFTGENEKIYIKNGNIVPSDSFTTCVYLEHCICASLIFKKICVFSEQAGSMWVYWSFLFNSFVSLEFWN
jgi:hypothetical protein